MGINRIRHRPSERAVFVGFYGCVLLRCVSLCFFRIIFFFLFGDALCSVFVFCVLFFLSFGEVTVGLRFN